MERTPHQGGEHNNRPPTPPAESLFDERAVRDGTEHAEEQDPDGLLHRIRFSARQRVSAGVCRRVFPQESLRVWLSVCAGVRRRCRHGCRQNLRPLGDVGTLFKRIARLRRRPQKLILSKRPKFSVGQAREG
jgi:hypothetical protein